MFSLKDKVAIITGGSSGIGKATAERFTKAGAKVVIAARHDRNDVAGAVGGTFVETDVSVEDEVQSLMDKTAQRLGRIDVLVNNAGAYAGAKEITDRSAAEMKEAFGINTLGAFFGMKHAVKYMSRGSSIINVSSLAAVMGIPGYSDYAASKFALNGITRGAALEFGPKGIRVNCVCPSSVNTPMLWHADVAATEVAYCRTMSALDAIIEPEDMAALIHFLAADDCPKITGQEIVIDAGISAGWSVAAWEAVTKSIGQG
jgi:3alpha(or 20beta)-hydroxysteroid dehydrogenase